MFDGQDYTVQVDLDGSKTFSFDVHEEETPKFGKIVKEVEQDFMNKE